MVATLTLYSLPLLSPFTLTPSLRLVGRKAASYGAASASHSATPSSTIRCSGISPDRLSEGIS